MITIPSNILLNMTESETFDFKSSQYTFYNATDEEKAELLKDIIAFANAWKTGEAYVVIGVSEKNGRKDAVVGVTNSLKDNDIQQFINSKTNRPIRFLVYSDNAEGHEINVIQIAREQPRPIYLSKAFGKLKPNDVHIRSGSSTAIASPDQIAEMAKADHNAIVGETRIAIEWADSTNHTRLGTEVELSGTRLIDPPPPPPKPIPRPPARTASRSASMFDQMNIVQAQMVKVNPIYQDDGPTVEEIKSYAQNRALYCPIQIWLKNIGARNTANVKVKVTIPKKDGVNIVDVDSLPQKPRGRGLMSLIDAHTPRLQIDSHVSELPTLWIVEIDAKTIQPQAEFWSCDSIFIASSIDQTIEAVATIYADDLAKPLEFSLRIHTKVVDREITAADLQVT